MPIEILMPALSPTMTEGNLAKWNIKEGDKITAGKVIAEIETDKATMEVEAVDEGVIGKILVAAGTEAVKVNQVIALLLEDGEDKKALDSYKPKAAAAEATKTEETKGDAAPAAAAPAAAQAPVAGLAKPSFSLPPQSVAAKAPAASRVQNSGDIFASPLARRVADQEGIDLKQVFGTGPNGRILVADVQEAKANGVGGAFGSGGRGVSRNPVDYFEVPVSSMRKVIARRLTESKQWVPHFYLNVEINLDKLLEVRKELNSEASAGLPKGEQPPFKLSVNDFIIKAVGLAMKKVPASNASWIDDKVYQYNNVDVSVAVAIEGGLITPIVQNADQKSVIAISNEMKDLAGRARQGKLQPHEYQGGGFSISNLGMFGIKNFNAIINPPQACILAVGAGEQRPVVKHGKLEIATVMDATLSVDHRVVDGAVGAEFLSALKRYLESPSLLLV
ncbi:MAG: pyruvate dehydrogenase complex dihydrolipoamide acetyltransferase [Alphaproteobacteria bacterium]|nr:pyruvate dehydrogenase complex dihydrolipoamide acetyltransferase [Alphaproteobacteria bacterium]